MNADELTRILEDVERRCDGYLACRVLDLHGLEHLRRVARTAGELAAATGQDIEAAVVMGFLHDCARLNDGSGNQHAHDSADVAARTLPKLYPHLDAARLCDGIRRHADGEVTDDPLIACLWDADRLDLARLGRIINPALLSTDAARRMIAG